MKGDRFHKADLYIKKAMFKSNKDLHLKSMLSSDKEMALELSES